MKKYLQIPDRKILNQLVEETKDCTQLIDAILAEATKGMIHKLFESSYIYLPILWQFTNQDGMGGPVPEDPTTIHLVTLEPVAFKTQSFSIHDLLMEEIHEYLAGERTNLKPLIALKNKLLPILKQIEQLENENE